MQSEFIILVSLMYRNTQSSITAKPGRLVTLIIASNIKYSMQPIKLILI